MMNRAAMALTLTGAGLLLLAARATERGNVENLWGDFCIIKK